MPNYYYTDANGQKQGPVSEEQLRELASQRAIAPHTPMETEDGHKGLAGQIPGLFAATAPPFNSMTPEAADDNPVSASVSHFPPLSTAEGQFIPAIFAGAVAAVVCAVIWSIITVVTEYQIGWMAIGVGFVVGISMQMAGKGKTPIYGVFGAAFSLLACVIGNLFAICFFTANAPEFAEEGYTTMELFLGCLMNPLIALDVLTETFTPMDFLFYGLALYLGYKTSFSREV